MRLRFVEVRADLGTMTTPRWRYGSGFLIGGRSLLTAAHVVRDAISVTVRGADKVILSAVHDQAMLGDPRRMDLALLEIPELTDLLPFIPVALVNRDTTTGDFINGCWAVGYPYYQEINRDSSMRWQRVSAHIQGYIPPLSSLGDELGLLSLHVNQVPAELAEPGQSPWSGMSGAAVFSGEMLLGVITEHTKRRGASEISLTPLDRLIDSRTAPDNASLWWKRLGVSDPGNLPLLPSTRKNRAEPAYHATMRVIKGRTKILRDREDELRRIKEFATGGMSKRYLMLIGGAWAGKTALLAEAVFAMPASVDVVAYFLSARESQASQEQFLAAVVPQLAWLLNIDTPPTANIHDFRDLWERASKKAAKDYRYLLLVVDGLDEDLRIGGHSVAALLPTEFVNRHARVLVSSRRYPELPGDVDSMHPLRKARVMQLLNSPNAIELKILAEQEINALLPVEFIETPGADLPFRVLGLLTAAAGALSVSDLTAMTEARAHAVRAFVTYYAARSLERIGPANNYRYQFAHQTLLELCQRHPDLGGDEHYREKLYEWAEHWRSREWPIQGLPSSCTPYYLLDSYPAALAGDPANPNLRPTSPRRLKDLVCDYRWLTATIECIGIDSARAAVRTAKELNPGDDDRLDNVQRIVESGLSHFPVSAVVTGDGRVVSGGLDGTIRLWDAGKPDDTGTVLGYHNGPTLTVAVTSDGRVVSGGHDGAVRLWDLAKLGDPGLVLGRHNSTVRTVAVTSDNRVVSGGLDGVVRLWDANVPDDRGYEVGRHSAVFALAVTSDDRVVSGGLDGAIKLWDPSVVGDPGREVGRHNAVRALASTSNDYVVSGGLDGTIRLWDADRPDDSGYLIAQYNLGPASLAVTDDGQILVTTGRAINRLSLARL